MRIKKKNPNPPVYVDKTKDETKITFSQQNCADSDSRSRTDVFSNGDIVGEPCVSLSSPQMF